MTSIYLKTYLGFGLATMIMQIILYFALDNNPNTRTKRWNWLFGFSVAIIIADVAFAVVMSMNAIGWDMLSDAIVLLPFLITHIALLTSGTTKKDKYKPEIIRLNKSFIIIALITLLISGTMVAMPLIIRRVNVLNHLRKNYGEDNYEIVKIYNKSHLNDAIHKYYDGYAATVKAHNAKKVYTVNVSKTGEFSHDDVITMEEYEENVRKVDESMQKIIRVNNIEKHYVDELERVIGKKYNIDSIDIDLTNEKVPDTSEIPTFDELVKDGALTSIHMRNKHYKYSKEESKKYIDDLATDLVTYMAKELKISKDSKLTVFVNISTESSKEIASYWIKIENNIVKIIDDINVNNMKVIKETSLDAFRN